MPARAAGARLPRHRHAALDGFEACRRLRAEPATADATIVMLTAAAGDDAEREAEDAGADLFLTKPFSPLDLLKLVHDLGDGSRREGLPRAGLERRRPAATLSAAARRSTARRVVRLLAVYETAPQGEVLDQPDFLNAVPRDRDRARHRGAARPLQAVERGLGREPAARATGRARSTSTCSCSASSSTTPSGSRCRTPRSRTRRFVIDPLLGSIPSSRCPTERALAPTSRPARA